MQLLLVFIYFKDATVVIITRHQQCQWLPVEKNLIMVGAPPISSNENILIRPYIFGVIMVRDLLCVLWRNPHQLPPMAANEPQWHQLGPEGWLLVSDHNKDIAFLSCRWVTSKTGTSFCSAAAMGRSSCMTCECLSHLCMSLVPFCIKEMLRRKFAFKKFTNRSP